MKKHIRDTLFGRISYVIVCRVTRLFMRVVFGLRVEGIGNIPNKGKAIIAANHVSAYDPPIVGCVVPRRMRFMAKRQLIETPIIGWLLALVNVHPVDRDGFGRDAIEALESSLKEDQPVMLFPEGTRQTDGRLGKPKLGVGMLAARNEAPVVPAYVSGTTTQLKAFARVKPFRIVFGPPINPPYEVAGISRKLAYQQIADEVMARVADLKMATEGMSAEQI
ncbi:MAG: lysophospholipid acyltransferase family protein [Candidatus Latescibacteria bacterium]|jgi:1-acyl-sn-glycerol-3-phosphate acyltransferase|nr:lysophospholipid acyltransferase family protein [Candidatus Latescibacterota bacterium]